MRGRKVRTGLAIALIAMIGAVLIRASITGGNDQAIYQHRSEVTGIDFGEWPEFFYTSAGGDGEVFAVLAADPWGQGPSHSVRSVLYRYTRIGLPLAVWVLSGDQSEYVLPLLAFVGLLCVGGLGFFAGYFHERFGKRSFLFVANPALFIGFMSDTAEPLAIVILAASLLGIGGVWVASILGVVRPSFATAYAGRWSYFTGALLLAVLTRLVALQIFGGSLDEGAGNLTIPLLGFFQSPSLLATLVGVAGLSTVVVGIKRRDFAWILSGLFVLIFGPSVLVDPINALRGAGMLPVLWAIGPKGPTS